MTSNRRQMTQADTSYHYIFIWMPLGTSQVGHASLYLSNRQYVSWWPQEEKAKCGINMKESNCKNNLQEDVEEEGMDPDYRFMIPSTTLNLAKMMTYWNKQKSTGHYSLLDQNCCWVLYQVLHAGGAPKSLTLLWRPETLRRYLVIYLGGGSRFTSMLNMSGWDSPFKEKITLYTWKARGGTGIHHALLLDNSVYVSWWPRTSQAAGHAANNLMEDRTKMDRVEDETYIFPDNELEYHLMRRRWKQMTESSELWGARSDWVIQEVLIAGGASNFQIVEITFAHRMFERE
ncbi:uncharacterized protein LOC124119038 [Haliotis rufescens]|uniref:uncharacterized protein LOC124119038 n=1 Tax=Haliotis rufescens TaxID=6454 RepID=UPI00201EB7CF|nr:uncharacterized protein LOC124119038 [Haliotis rufescens]